MQIDRTGRITTGTFIPHHTFRHWWRCPPYYGSFSLEDEPGTNDLFDAAKLMGISPDEVQALLDYGCSAGEIEELLYDPSLLHELTGELLYAY